MMIKTTIILSSYRIFSATVVFEAFCIGNIFWRVVFARVENERVVVGVCGALREGVLREHALLCFKRIFLCSKDVTRPKSLNTLEPNSEKRSFFLRYYCDFLFYTSCVFFCVYRKIVRKIDVQMRFKALRKSHNNPEKNESFYRNRFVSRDPPTLAFWSELAVPLTGVVFEGGSSRYRPKYAYFRTVFVPTAAVAYHTWDRIDRIFQDVSRLDGITSELSSKSETQNRNVTAAPGVTYGEKFADPRFSRRPRAR